MDLDYVIDDLCFRYRHVTAAHFSDPRKARVRCERLVAAGVLVRKDVIAAPATHVEQIYAHVPCHSLPDCDRIAKNLQLRWNAVEPRPVRLYYATQKTIQRVGGDMPGGPTNADVISHDVGITASFLAIVAANPALRTAWIPEERIPAEYGEVHPDALFADSHGPRALFEFCGSYSSSRIRRLCQFSTAKQLPLHFWTVAKETA